MHNIIIISVWSDVGSDDKLQINFARLKIWEAIYLQEVTCTLQIHTFIVSIGVAWKGFSCMQILLGYNTGGQHFFKKNTQQKSLDLCMGKAYPH